MTNSRDKGKRGELEIAHILQDRGYDARRGQQFSGANGDADVVGIPGIHLEVKRTEQFRLWEYLTQAINDARNGEKPVVAWKANRKPWVVVMPFHDFLDLLEEADYGRR